MQSGPTNALAVNVDSPDRDWSLRLAKVVVKVFSEDVTKTRQDQVDKAIKYLNGQLKIERFKSNPDGIGSKRVGEESRVVDVTYNWELYPRFGDYAGLATRDRCPPLLSDPRVSSNVI